MESQEGEKGRIEQTYVQKEKARLLDIDRKSTANFKTAKGPTEKSLLPYRLSFLTGEGETEATQQFGVRFDETFYSYLEPDGRDGSHFTVYFFPTDLPQVTYKQELRRLPNGDMLTIISSGFEKYSKAGWEKLLEISRTNV